MSKITPSNKIYLDSSRVRGAGRGIFARIDIKKGEIIERCPIINVPEYDTSNLTESILVSYFFYFDKGENRCALALGYGSIYNHSDYPNAKFQIIPKENIIKFTAIQDIKKGSEITFNYRGSNMDSDKAVPLWFES